MRILYIDIDSLRPDHLGCYGYHRDTSPNIDRIAAEGVRFDNVFVSDAPCVPSRSSLFSGRMGIHTGVIDHGGTASDPFVEGPGRTAQSTLSRTSWIRSLRDAGLRTVTVSSFGDRHSAWHWYASFNEIYNPALGGRDRADHVAPVATDWIKRHGTEDDWFLHVNFWDPHEPYRTPADFGDPFDDQPLPAWYTESVRRRLWDEGVGPSTARFHPANYALPANIEMDFSRQQSTIDSMAEARRMFDGYDTGVLFADHYIGQILNCLADQGVLEETAIIISADHGENLGELNIHGNHETADAITTRVPLIVRWPGATDGQAGRVDDALHYHLDFAATSIELVGGTVPDNWDGVSFADTLRQGESSGRDHLVVSQAVVNCQRGVRFDRDGCSYMCVRTYFDCYYGFDEIMLFDLSEDPHEQHNLAAQRPEIVAHAMTLLDQWHAQMMQSATHEIDPMTTVLREGPSQSRGIRAKYLDRLRAAGRDDWAQRVEAGTTLNARRDLAP
jgi:choline-sulfatase